MACSKHVEEFHKLQAQTNAFAQDNGFTVRAKTIGDNIVIHKFEEKPEYNALRWWIEFVYKNRDFVEHIINNFEARRKAKGVHGSKTQ